MCVFICKRFALPALALAVALPASAVEARPWDPDLQVTGLAGFRAVLPSDARARIDGGPSRVRFGDGSDGGEDVLADIAEIAVEVEARANDWLSLFLHAQYQPEDDQIADLVSGFIRIEPPAMGRTAVSFKGGAFFPGISKENRGTAWSNTYTLTNSASKSWIGEDVRPIGTALGVTYTGDSYALGIEGTAFFANDVSGAALARGGWSLTDIKTPLTGAIRTFNPSDPDGLSVFEPFREGDGRPGVQMRVDLDIFALGGISLLYWNNLADLDKTIDGDSLWRTRFFAADAEVLLPWSISLLPQIMVGRTEHPTLGTRFLSASALAARHFGPVRGALRLEYFAQDNIRDMPELRLDEEGHAVTAAASYALGRYHQFIGEVVYVRSQRDGSALPAARDQNETLFQLEYRFGF